MITGLNKSVSLVSAQQFLRSNPTRRPFHISNSGTPGDDRRALAIQYGHRLGYVA